MFERSRSVDGTDEQHVERQGGQIVVHDHAPYQFRCAGRPRDAEDIRHIRLTFMRTR